MHQLLLLLAFCTYLFPVHGVEEYSSMLSFITIPASPRAHQRTLPARQTDQVR